MEIHIRSPNTANTQMHFYSVALFISQWAIYHQRWPRYPFRVCQVFRYYCKCRSGLVHTRSQLCLYFQTRRLRPFGARQPPISSFVQLCSLCPDMLLSSYLSAKIFLYFIEGCLLSAIFCLSQLTHSLTKCSVCTLRAAEISHQVFKIQLTLYTVTYLPLVLSYQLLWLWKDEVMRKLS